jgi:hypothetical protein
LQPALEKRFKSKSKTKTPLKSKEAISNGRVVASGKGMVGNIFVGESLCIALQIILLTLRLLQS